MTVVKEPISESGKSGSCGIPLPGMEAKVNEIKPVRNLTKYRLPNVGSKRYLKRYTS